MTQTQRDQVASNILERNPMIAVSYDIATEAHILAIHDLVEAGMSIEQAVSLVRSLS